MTRNKKLKLLRKSSPILPRDEKFKETLETSKAVYFRQDTSHPLSRWEFLWSQFQLTRKRWWFLQGAMLALACQLLPAMEQDFRRIRSIGVIGCLFVIFMIPELWRNKSSESTQVEAACLYSLREIYAARITLFALVDVLLLTVFAFSLQRTLALSFVDIMAQLLVPVTVTACICFGMLSIRHDLSETVSLAVSLTWSAVWWLILMSEHIYYRILPELWAGIFALSLLLLGLAIRKAIRGTNLTWEVSYYETGIG